MAGRRGKWLVLAFWIVLLVVFAPIGSKLADKTQDDTESFLPKNAESTKVVRALDKDFKAGETSDGLIVYQREGGLTAADKDKIRRDAFQVSSEIPVTQSPAVPFLPSSPPGLVSPDGSVAYTVITVPLDFDKLGDWGKEVKDATGEGSGGLKIYLTGDLGFNTDADEVFSSIDTKLLLATVLLVLILLGAIYRSPIVALIPIVVVGVRLHGRARPDLPLCRHGRDGLLELDQHHRRAHVRGGDRLLPAARVPLPRGTAHPRRQARGDAARGPARRPGDPGQRPDRHPGHARPPRRRGRAPSTPWARWPRSACSACSRPG